MAFGKNWNSIIIIFMDSTRTQEKAQAKEDTFSLWSLDAKVNFREQNGGGGDVGGEGGGGQDVNKL